MNLDRRNSLKLLGGSVVGAYSLAMLGGCETLLEQINNRPVRRSFASLANNDPIIQAYRAGVAAMKELPGSDRRNWMRQAQIHADFCPHGNWYFLPWHRAYLYYFETIIRELSGYQEFALPYWNWTCQPRIPAPFFDHHELYDATRNRSRTDTISQSLTGEAVMSGILNIPDFEAFGSYASTALRNGSGGGFGELEATPHNSIHVWVGGNMGSVPIAARDPIFWCHHNMIERCWWDWNITQNKPNPSSANWKNMALNNMFCDHDGNLVDDLKVGFTALYPIFYYQYDDQLLPCGGVTSGLATSPRKGEDLRRFLEQGGPARLQVQEQVSANLPRTLVLKGGATEEVDLPRQAMKMLLHKQRDTQRLVLRVQNARQLEEQDVFVRLFVNLPANGNVRSSDNIHYAGSFAFFGHGEHSHEDAQGSTFNIDISDTVIKLLKAGVIAEGQSLKVQLSSASISDEKAVPKGHVELSGIEILLSEGFEKQ